MPTGTVKVLAPANTLLCINGNYDPDFPRYAIAIFTVEYGPNRFEAVSGEGMITHRAIVTTDDDHLTLTISLDPLVPPQPRG